jgi:hypothetical protein
MDDKPLFSTTAEDEENKDKAIEVAPLPPAEDPTAPINTTPTVNTPTETPSGRDLGKYVKVVTSLTDGNPDQNVDMLQPDFVGSLGKAFQAMPEELRSAINIEQAGRSSAYQAKLYQRYKLGGPLAAPPGHSRHEDGRAVDIGPASGNYRDPAYLSALNWLYQRSEEFGIINPPSIRNRDSGHFQFVRPDPTLKTVAIPYDVSNAIDTAARKYGLDRRMLYSIAYGESNYDRSGSSSAGATGLFQMMPETWGDLVSRYGKNFPEISNWDRKNPMHNALMMGALTRENQAVLHEKLGRDPTPGEIYGAHFLGASGYGRFVSYAKDNPHEPALNGVSPRAVAQNRSVFYRANGQPRTAEEVQTWMDRKASTAPGFNDKNEKLKELITATQDGYKVIPGVASTVATAEGAVAPGVAKADAVLANANEYAARAERQRTRVNAAQNGVSAAADIGYRRISYEDLFVPPAVNSRDISKQIEARMDHREATAPFSTLVMDAFKDTNTLSWMFAGAPQMAPDPNFFMTEEMAKKAVEGIDPRFHSWVINSYSAGQLQKAREDALSFMEGEKRLDEAGLTGMALRLGTAFLDPVAIGVALGTEGLAAPMLFGKAASVGGKLKAGLLASTGNVAATGALQLSGDPRITGQDYLLAGVAGFGLGALFGKGIKPELPENQEIAAKASEIVDGLAGPSSAGAAQNLDASFVSPKLDADWSRLKNDDVWESPVPKALPLWGTVDKALRSKNPAARLVAPHLAENAVGFKGHGTIPIAASERARRLESSFEARYADAHRTAFQEYLKEVGGGWIARWTKTGEFADKVGLAIREKDPAIREQMSPAARKLADKQIALQDELLELEKNPGVRMGKEMASVEGFNEVVNKGSYLMRVWDNAKLKTLGQPKLARMLRGAIRDEQPDLDERYVRKLADGAAEKMMERTHGLDDYFDRALSGADEEALTKVLKELGFTDEDEVEEVLKSFQKVKEKDKENPARAKRRMLLNETYETEIDGQKYKLSDFLVNDAPALFKARNRQATSRIALAQVQIRDPKTGELLVDGIRSDKDFEHLIEQVKARGASEGQTPRQIADDEKQLRFIYDYMTGRLKMPDNGVMDVLRLTQKFNFSRVMNQVGFAQIPEMATSLSHLGVRASMEHMPEFKRIIGMSAKELDQHGTLDEMQYIMGQSTAMLRSHITSRFDDEATNGFHKFTKGTAFDKVEAGLENMNRVTSTLSGMNGVTDMLQHWNSLLVGQTFVNLAHGAKEVDGRLVFSNANMRRLKSLGIDTETSTKFKYKNPKYKGADMVKMKAEYDNADKLERAKAAGTMKPEDKKLYDSLKIRLKEVHLNADVMREADLPDIEAITSKMDELLEKNGYKAPAYPTFKGEAKFIEGEGTMLERIARQVKEHATTEKGIYNDKKFKLMNYNSWTDLEAREAFIDTLFRASRRMVQENDVGQMATWMSTPMARILLQFRTFMMAGYSKQLLHNLHHAGAFGGGTDAQNLGQTFTYFSASVVFGSLAYAMQSKIQSLGRSDADEFLYDEDKGKLTHKNLALAGVQRAGWSSIIPLVMDSARVGELLTGDPLFAGTRSSGQVSNAIFGNPTASFAESALSIPPMVGDMIRDGRSPAQPELRKGSSLLPFQNMLGVQQMYNYLISDFDEEKPRQ